MAMQGDAAAKAGQLQAGTTLLQGVSNAYGKSQMGVS
jgi:hypothetical protein